MKTVSVRELQQHVKACVSAAQRDRVVLTRHGKPAAVLVGVEGKDWEQVTLGTSPEFWRLIERRRKEKLVPLKEIRKRLKA